MPCLSCLIITRFCLWRSCKRTKTLALAVPKKERRKEPNIYIGHAHTVPVTGQNSERHTVSVYTQVCAVRTPRTGGEVTRSGGEARRGETPPRLQAHPIDRLAEAARYIPMQTHRTRDSHPLASRGGPRTRLSGTNKPVKVNRTTYQVHIRATSHPQAAPGCAGRRRAKL